MVKNYLKDIIKDQISGLPTGNKKFKNLTLLNKQIDSGYEVSIPKYIQKEFEKKVKRLPRSLTEYKPLHQFVENRTVIVRTKEYIVSAFPYYLEVYGSNNELILTKGLPHKIDDYDKLIEIAKRSLDFLKRKTEIRHNNTESIPSRFDSIKVYKAK